MCYDEGVIQAYIDRELSVREAGKVQGHLDMCSDCGEMFRRLYENDSLVRSSMQGFAVADRERFNAEIAWIRLKLEKVKNEEKREKKCLRARRFKKIAVAAAILLVVAALICFARMRGVTLLKLNFLLTKLLPPA